MKAFLTKAKQPMEQAFPGLYRVLTVLFIVGMVIVISLHGWLTFRLIQDPNFNRNVSQLFAQRNVLFMALFIFNWAFIPLQIYAVLRVKKLGIQARLLMLSFSLAPLSNLGRLSCKADNLQRSLESFQLMSSTLLIGMVSIGYIAWVESLGKKSEESASTSDSA